MHLKYHELCALVRPHPVILAEPFPVHVLGAVHMGWNCSATFALLLLLAEGAHASACFLAPVLNCSLCCAEVLRRLHVDMQVDQQVTGTKQLMQVGCISRHIPSSS